MAFEIVSQNLSNPKALLLFGALFVLSSIFPLFGLVVILVLYGLSPAVENYGMLEKCGIPVVKPTLFLGSEPNYHSTVLHLEDIDRFKKFGGIWGSYVGKSPIIYVADPELIKLMYVRDFSYFADRQAYEFGADVMNELMDFQPGEKWKTLRNGLSPLFTTSKLKQMSDVLADSAKEFIEDLKGECNSEGRLKIDSRKRLTAWLIDMTARTTLGIRLEDHKNPDNKFAVAFRAMMAENQEYTKLFSLSLSFPILTKLAPTFNDQPTKLIESTVRQIMLARKASGLKNTKDFGDVLCAQFDKVPTKEYTDLKISETTIIAQAVNMFLGGYETSATTLSHLLLYMAEDPEVEQKMYDELQAALEKRRENDGKVEIDHDLIQDAEIPYITACINEALRLAPPLHRPERICTRDWTHNNINIKKGTIIMMAAWAANRNPEVYPDEPEKFKPERFLPENKAKLDPYAFTSFGFGPRNCIGMRFAYESLKLFTCNFVKEFRVEKRRDTEMKYKTGSSIVVGFNPLYLDIVKRE